MVTRYDALPSVALGRAEIEMTEEHKSKCRFRRVFLEISKKIIASGLRLFTPRAMEKEIMSLKEGREDDNNLLCFGFIVDASEELDEEAWVRILAAFKKAVEDEGGSAIGGVHKNGTSPVCLYCSLPAAYKR